MATAAAPASGSTGSTTAYKDKSKPAEVRSSNITAAKAVADAIRTSLGPKGMDKMIQGPSGDVTITNDGATILKQMQVIHPAAKMLVELSKAQDVAAGDGTTTVAVIAGSLLAACEKLLAKGLHPSAISDAFGRASLEAVKVLEGMSEPIALTDRAALIKNATTSLNSKIVSQHSALLAPMVVDAVLKVADGDTVDLKDIKIVQKLEGTIEDTELIDGVVLSRHGMPAAGAPDRVEKAKIALIQFCLSAPKTDLENQVVVSDYAAMDRVLRDERQYILNICKKVKKAGANVILVQKSILREAVSDLALHFLAKMKVMVVQDVEREDVEFVCKSLGCRPIASVDHMTADMLGSADLVEEVAVGSSEVVKFTGVQGRGKTVTVMVRGSNKLVLDEAERSIHDALCVIRCLVKRRAVIAGGSAPEAEMSLRLAEIAQGMGGSDAYCLSAYAEALDVVPFTLAENAGLNPIATVTELRARHKAGERTAGINVRKGAVTDMLAEQVVQPLLVSVSAITLATETVRSILKIDDIVNTR